MNVIYIQDQEIYECHGKYFHSKSENYFLRYLSGINKSENLIVYTGIVSMDDEKMMERYQNITHPRIKYIAVPEFRKPQNIMKIMLLMQKAVRNADFCYMRCGVAASFAQMYCRMQKKPYMAIVNEDVYRNLACHASKLYRIVAPIIGFGAHVTVKHADYACYVTQQFLQKRYPCRGKSIGCSDIETLTIDEYSLSKRLDQITQMQYPIKIGSIGSVSTPLKGQDTVIRAIAELKKMGNQNYCYFMVGTGDPARLQSLAKELDIEDQVKFLGEFSHEDVLDWFDKIDIYVHPSRSEGLPRTILEAMTKATPCICSSVGGVPELIQDEWLFSYDGNEVDNLAHMLTKMDAEKMRQAAPVNFQKSKEYNPILLDQKRSSFFKKAADNARSRKND